MLDTEIEFGYKKENGGTVLLELIVYQGEEKITYI
jgi:hypothetical protein